MNNQNKIAMSKKKKKKKKNTLYVILNLQVMPNLFQPIMHISVFILIVLVTFYHFPKHCNFVDVGLHHLPDLLLE